MHQTAAADVAESLFAILIALARTVVVDVGRGRLPKYRRKCEKRINDKVGST